MGCAKLPDLSFLFESGIDPTLEVEDFEGEVTEPTRTVDSGSESLRAISQMVCICLFVGPFLALNVGVHISVETFLEQNLFAKIAVLLLMMILLIMVLNGVHLTVINVKKEHEQELQ